MEGLQPWSTEVEKEKKSWFVIRKVQNGNGVIGVKMADGREEEKGEGTVDRKANKQG